MRLPIWSEPLDTIDDLALTAAQISPFAAVPKTFKIPNEGPIFSLWIVETYTCKAFAAGDMVRFGLLNALERVTLEVNDGDESRGKGGKYNIVDCSGEGLVLHNDLEDGIDPYTAHALAESNADVVILAGEIVQITRRIDFVHPRLVGPLAVRSCLHAQQHKQEPTLKLRFGGAAAVGATADPFSAISVQVYANRLMWDDDLEKRLREEGGPIISDIVEYEKGYGLSQANLNYKFPLENGCELANMALWHEYQSSTIRDLSSSTTIGSETVHSIKVGQKPFTYFHMKQAQLGAALSRRQFRPVSAFHPMMNDAINGINASGVTTGAPPVWVTAKQLHTAMNPGGPLGVGTGRQDPGVVGLEFLSDRGESTRELTGCLPCRFSGDTHWNVTGQITTPATTDSKIKSVQRRYLSDITPYKTAHLFS